MARALDALGPSVAAAAGSVLRLFKAELSDLPTRLQEPQGARAIALSLVPLLERLAMDDVVRAAWDDACASYRGEIASAECCELRLLQLTELSEHRGHDWAALARRLEEILGDDPDAIGEYDDRVRGRARACRLRLRRHRRRRALQRLGARRRRKRTVRERAFSLQEHRLRAAGKAVAREPVSSPTAVWFVISYAALATHYQDVGPVRFFNGSVWPAAFLPGGTLEMRDQSFTAPAELHRWDEVGSVLTELPPAEHRVLARVCVEGMLPSRARQRAREVLRSLIDLANPETEWLLLDGEVSHSEGVGWFSQTFADPAERRSRVLHPAFERTGQNLSEVEPGLAQRLLDGEPLMTEAVEDALWTIEVERADNPAQRIALATRGFERAFSRARVESKDPWVGPTKRYLKALWIDHVLYDELLDAAATAVDLPWERRPGTAWHRRWASVHDASFRPPNGRFDPRGFAGVAGLASRRLPVGSLRQRIVREADATLNDPEATLARLDTLGQRFDCLLRRLLRWRNALVHGSASASSVPASVDAFVVLLSRYVAQEAVQSALGGQEPLVELERRRVQHEERRARLEAGGRPVDVLYPA